MAAVVLVAVVVVVVVSAAALALAALAPRCLGWLSSRESATRLRRYQGHREAPPTAASRYCVIRIVHIQVQLAFRLLTPKCTRQSRPVRYRPPNGAVIVVVVVEVAAAACCDS